MTQSKKSELSSTHIELLPLAEASTEVQLKILDIRNEQDVRKWMYVDTPIELNEHLQWLQQSKMQEQQRVFVVMENRDKPIGLIKLANTNTLHKTSDWAYYLSSDAKTGIGPAIEYAFLNFVFEVAGIEKLNCEVIEGNDGVVKLHKKFLFREEGFRLSNIIKNGTRIGVHFLGLTKAEWMAGRDTVFEKYQKSFQRFPTSITWDESKGGRGNRHPIDEIESARARNNLNWMNILRLVLELSPDHGRALVGDIRKIDKEISDLTDKLLSK